MLIEHLLLGERDAVYTGHLVALGIATPEGAGNACYLYSLYCSGAHEVRTAAQVGEGSLCVGCDGAVFKIFFNVLTLIFLSCCLKLFQGLGFGNLFAHHGLVLLCELLHLSLNLGEIVLADHVALLRHDVIEEAVFNGWSKAKLYAWIELLQGLCQQVG